MNKLTKKATHRYTGRFKSEDELFMIHYKKTWKGRGNNFDIVRIESVYADFGENKIIIRFFLLDKLIILCPVVYGYENIFVKYIPSNHAFIVEFLDSTERKGAAIFLVIPTRRLWKHLKLWITPESCGYYVEHFNEIIITMPIKNRGSRLINRISHRLYEFYNPSTSRNNSCETSSETIDLFQLEILISLFMLRPVSYTFDEEYENTRMFESENVETDETYHVNGNAVCFFFKVNGFTATQYIVNLNEWRLTMEKPVDGNLENNKNYYKIFNTLLYMKLTKWMTCNSTEELGDNSLYQL
uniref:DUF4365 domain-containing protein n=1 Tax=Strongyloides venezuelensis TaxID=75913 RepID=A0A0K0F244_STRVS